MLFTYNNMDLLFFGKIKMIKRIPTINVSANLPQPLYDQLVARAKKETAPLAEIIRLALMAYLGGKK